MFCFSLLFAVNVALPTNRKFAYFQQQVSGPNFSTYPIRSCANGTKFLTAPNNSYYTLQEFTSPDVFSTIWSIDYYGSTHVDMRISKNCSIMVLCESSRIYVLQLQNGSYKDIATVELARLSATSIRLSPEGDRLLLVRNGEIRMYRWVDSNFWFMWNKPAINGSWNILGFLGGGSEFAAVPASANSFMVFG